MPKPISRKRRERSCHTCADGGNPGEGVQCDPKTWRQCVDDPAGGLPHWKPKPGAPKLQDPLADAIDQGITFDRDQCRWLCHHLANPLTGIAAKSEDTRAKSVQRCVAVLDAVKAQTRPPYPGRVMEDRKRCIVCDRLAELGPGAVCSACSDEEET